jgi:D-ribulokinase
MMELFVGIDFGTSGCRAIALDSKGEVYARAQIALPPPQRTGTHSEQDPSVWWDALWQVLVVLTPKLQGHLVRTIAVDGTSSTLLLCDDQGTPLGRALMYHDSRSRSEANYLRDLVPTTAANVAAPTSSLAKLLHLRKRFPNYSYVLHQSDWIMGCLTGLWGFSDENNALKLGYDARLRAWPHWIEALNLKGLPHVLAAATPLAPMLAIHARALGWRQAPWIVTGTTDSTAAFIASGAHISGEAVTTLGSTLVMKILSDKPLDVPEYGIYSHRLSDGRWLVGGASNSGGAVLLQYFSPDQMMTLSQAIQPDQPTGLDYYPLPCPGERFPCADPLYPPRLSPRPPEDVLFFQGLLEGMAEIERIAYTKLQDLGAPPLRCVYTCGGGANNDAWQRIRSARLGVPVKRAQHTEAAYGSAMLAYQARLFT